MPPVWTLLLLLHVPTLVRALVNFTIDDTSPDIVYSGPWRLGPHCPTCHADPKDSQSAFQGTWHDGLFDADTSSEPLFANFTFYGSAIQCFGIQGNAIHHSDSFASVLTFLIDGDEVGSFTHRPTGGDDYTFNVLLYENKSIPDGHHVFSLQNGPIVDETGRSLVLFDYLIYGQDRDNTTASGGVSSPLGENRPHKNNAGAIAGGVIGGLVFLLLLGSLLFLWHRRRRQQQSVPGPRTSPDLSFTLSPGSWFSVKPRADTAPFNPNMMVARSPAAAPVPLRALDLTSGEPVYPAPSQPLHPTQNRILAWQQQTARETTDPPRSPVAPSVVLSSYWDQSTESYRSWEARQQSPVPFPPEKEPGTFAVPDGPSAPTPVQTTLSPPAPPVEQAPRSPRRAAPARRLTVMNN